MSLDIYILQLTDHIKTQSLRIWAPVLSRAEDSVTVAWCNNEGCQLITESDHGATRPPLVSTVLPPPPVLISTPPKHCPVATHTSTPTPAQPTPVYLWSYANFCPASDTLLISCQSGDKCQDYLVPLTLRGDSISCNRWWRTEQLRSVAVHFVFTDLKSGHLYNRSLCVATVGYK